MTTSVRYYFELNPCVVDRYGGYQYLTVAAEKPDDGWLPRIAGGGPNTFNQLMMNSDRVILCEKDSVRYIKHRQMNHKLAVIDPDEFFEIKLRSVEI